ncbi:expressed unknown protein [Seminavis robusta]|uniref:Uncharacterized protein n=1 Tax=Seminavis robusta TaxID=568900 RepID=A0A9N8H1J6_9STRA|nr:expressed unknown protein [Seminavis robusta]|eukprot:Sro4_g003670.1 n/a (271) ;mRNA; r:219341-220153
MFRSVLLLPLLVASACDAFVLQPSTTSKAGRTTILSASHTDDELNNLEEARANFEFLMQTKGLLRDDADLPLPHNKDDYTPRPLTESSRHRRELEMELLQSLQDSDDAVEELMGLWMVERGMEAGEALQAMEMACSPGLLKEEAILRELLDEFGVHWAEVVSRLASLKYFQGNTPESKQWTEIALAVKPWHFEVIHTCVLNALREQDLGAAVRWQRKALPPLNPDTNNRARKAWVRQALKYAQESMDKAEAAAAEKKKPRSFLKENEIWQ